MIKGGWGRNRQLPKEGKGDRNHPPERGGAFLEEASDGRIGTSEVAMDHTPKSKGLEEVEDD